MEHERQVTYKEAQDWANENNISVFMEVSSKKNINIKELVYQIANQFVDSEENISKIIGLEDALDFLGIN